jgi:hypothetical protein
VRAFLAVAVVLSASGGGTLRAQDLSFLNTVFKNVHSFAIQVQVASVTGGREIATANSPCIALGLCGAGAEMLIDLTAVEGRGHLELGLGASYLRGFAASEPSLDLRGALRSFPTVAAYYTGLPFLIADMRFYIGLSFGITDLWNAQVYDTLNVESTLKGQTFDYGSALGFAFVEGTLEGLYAEGSYKFRRFPSLDYGSPAISPKWPRELDFSGWQIAVGWQFDVRDKTPDKKPPVLAGRWALRRIDGAALPVLISQTERAPGSEGEQVITGQFSLDTAQRFDLRVQRRMVRFDASGRQTSMEYLPDLMLAGSYAIGDRGLLTLSPITAAGAAVPTLRVERAGDELIIIVSSVARRMHFERVGDF